MKLLPYFLLGTFFGAVLVESEAVSWFRMQEMFRFESVHMYGIMGSAVLTAFASLQVIRRLKLSAWDGTAIDLPPRRLGAGVRYVAGGLLFGIGWALTGACPGPLVALVGAGAPVMIVAILSALAGTWTYGKLRPRLPH